MVGCEVMFHFGAGHDAIAFFVDMQMNDVAFSYLHSFLLLAERAEHVFHDTPVQKGSVLVHPVHAEICKVAHPCQRCLRCGDGALVLVEIHEASDVVAHLCILWYVFLRHKNVAIAPSIEENTKHFFSAESMWIGAFGHFDHLQRVVVT